MDKTVTTLNDLILWLYSQRRAPVVFAETNVHDVLLTTPRTLLELVLVEAGSFRLQVGDQFADVSEGDILWFNAHFGNRAQITDSETAYSCFSLDVGNEPAFKDFAAGPWLRQVTCDAESNAAQAFSEIRRWHHAISHPLREPLLMAVILKFLGSLTAAGHVEFASAPSQEFTQALRIIEARQEDPQLLMGDVAVKAGISESTLRRLFQRHLQTSPAAYLASLRLHRGRDLLERTGLSVKEIAARVGYEDPLYFSRSFRRYHHQSPAEVRQNFHPRKPRSQAG